MTVTMEQIQEKTDAINLLLNDNNSRPSTKEEYVALLEQLRSERNALIAQKNGEEEAARQAAEQARIEYESSDEYKWSVIRDERNMLLLQCDWTQLIDSPLDDEQRELWRVYRQALRDITDTFTNPADVVLPTPPS